MKKKEEMVLALAKELELRKKEFQNQTVETIYFGGGTPSILTLDNLLFIIDTVYKHYQVTKNPEITLEANPDDLSDEKIKLLAQSPINRLSIGIQSFFDDDLKLMNRAHNSGEAKKCLEIASQYFENITIDLIYGIPNMSQQKWIENIETALSYNIPHISSYALTVEPKTALNTLIQKGKINAPSDEMAKKHFDILTQKLKSEGFIHYELSNFGKPDYFSINNTAYWLGKKYIGIGPSAHSFDGSSRSWNIANNSLYIKSIQSNQLPSETEFLSKIDKYNEYVMTGLRTIWGISLQKIELEFGKKTLDYLLKNAQKHLENNALEIKNETLTITEKGKFYSDGIASDLFLLNLE